jgi:hypothetical protein
MQKEPMKQKHFWLDRIAFNWTKLRFIKRNEKNKEIQKNIFFCSVLNKLYFILLRF